MGFSVKLAPGVRVRASSRGIRTSVGPRAARIHVGAGRTRVSSGIGPVTLSTSLGARRSGRRASTSGATAAGRTGGTSAAAAKLAEAHRLTSVIETLLSLHRRDVTEAERPLAAAPQMPDVGRVHRRHRQRALTGVSVFRRTARAAARRSAQAAAEEELERARLDAGRAWAREQQQLDDQWSALCRNDVPSVHSSVGARLLEGPSEATVLAVEGTTLDLLVVAPTLDVVPQKRVGTTAAGNLSVRAMTKGDRHALHARAVVGLLLLTLRETFAAAPGLRSARAAVTHPAVDGGECLVAGVWTREALSAVSWPTADAMDVARASAQELHLTLRGGKELRPLDPSLPLVRALRRT